MGFIPGAVSPPPTNAPYPLADAGYGFELGLFPINYVHNFIHLVVGIAGIVAYLVPGAVARTYALGLAIFYGTLAVCGLFPATYNTFGMAPIFGNDVWLHALTAAIGAYVGITTPREIVAEKSTDVTPAT